jgi:enamine deaminase RidA (YjgF/YER057c/UK114 family)
LIERHGSGSPYEGPVGYSRVVRAGNLVLVAGTTAFLDDGAIAGIGDPYAQARQALANIEAALATVDARLEDVVRTRMYVTDLSRAEEVTRAHGEVFGGIRPVTALIGVVGLLDPRMLVEIEAEAYLTR